ncbi:glycosyltransferase family 4 protein [Alteromonas sp. MTD1]|uniref:glycosyltransferase n=1 Tax=Alteromonas sp. MTD1 TaxID=3057962 RepID=UPI0036F3A330
MAHKPLNILVFSSLFPSEVRKTAGLFVRERMFRMREHAQITVVSPVPWFPGQGIIRFFFKGYRPMPAVMEVQDGVEVYFPRFLSFPFFFRSKDATFMAWSVRRLVKKLVKQKKINIIDSHFTYPDGLAATTLANEVGIPSTITMRGTEVPHSKDPRKLPLLQKAWAKASHVVAVSQSLKDVALEHGVEDEHVTVIGNGIDTEKFMPLDKRRAKEELGINPLSPVLITVGGLVFRKGFHRVIECLPDLKKKYPDIRYLVVGGPSLEGNIENFLINQCEELNVTENVIFFGAQPPEKLSMYISAADLFVLPTANEGWANVLLESLACCTPVIATDVGGNREVITKSDLGYIIPFGNSKALLNSLLSSLTKKWDGGILRQYAESNHWNVRVTKLHTLFSRLVGL